MPKGLSIHIAVPTPGPGCDAVSVLNGPMHDAEAMTAIATDCGFQVRYTMTGTVSGPMVVDALHTVAGELEAGDILLLTYSGHGDKRLDIKGKEELDSYDEVWCLEDGLFSDDQLHQALAKVPAEVRVVLISDSCHAGTMATLPNNLLAAAPHPSRHGRSGRSSAALDTAADGTQDLVLVKRRPPQVDIQASVLLISACRDAEKARDNGNNGLFTAKLVETWAGGEFDGGYEEFVRQVSRAVSYENPEQHPGMMYLGPVYPGFGEQHPFTILVEALAPVA